jgi:hypothetical protein
MLVGRCSRGFSGRELQARKPGDVHHVSWPVRPGSIACLRQPANLQKHRPATGAFSPIDTGYEWSQSLRVQSSARTKPAARESYCLTLLFLFQCEGVNIVRSYVANQHRCVCRIKTHPKGERPCATESLQIDNALRIATRYADSKQRPD